MSDSKDRPIFVSYARDDIDRVSKFVDALDDEGLSAFWDENVGGGQRWRDVIPDALDKAAAVVVVWTQTSVTREFVREEAQRAKDLKILIPVLFEGNVTIPFGFREIQCVDLCGWAGERNANFNSLVEMLRKMVDLRRRGPFYPEPAWNDNSFNRQLQATSQLRTLSGIIREVGEVLVDQRPVTKDVIDTLDEIRKTYRAVRRAIRKFVSPAYESGPIEYEPYSRMEDGSLETAIKRGLGHCTRILTLYRRHRGLRDSIRQRVNADKLREIDGAFNTLSTADRDMFDELGQIGAMLTSESGEIARMLATGQDEQARARIREGRARLEPLRRQLSLAIDELQEAQQALGYAG
jgi:hypothetical protein